MANQIKGYTEWLLKRGRARSADKYRRVATSYVNNPELIESKIADSEYSPNYRRNLVACLRSWAKYKKDTDLKEWLDDLVLPAAIPKDAREPFEHDEWFVILDEIEQAEYLNEPTRWVCCIIAIRGIRCGDVLRITKKEIRDALKTGILAFEGKRERRAQYQAQFFAHYLAHLLNIPWPKGATRVRQLVCPGSSPECAQDTAARTIREAFTRVADELELEPGELYGHRFRHTYATHYLAKLEGDPEAIFKLQQQMGWAKLDTAQNYLRRSRRAELDEVETQLLSGRKRKIDEQE